VLARALRDACAAEHPRDLLDPFFRAEHGKRRPGLSALRVLCYPDLPLGLCGHLCQVRHAQDLAGGRQRTQLPAHHLGDGAADTGIHFVEDEAGQVGRVDRCHLQGKADSRQLTSGRHLGEGARGLAGVGAHPELDVVPAVLGALVGAAGVDPGLEDAARHSQALHQLCDAAVQLRRRGTTRTGEAFREPVAYPSGLGQALLQGGEAGGSVA